MKKDIMVFVQDVLESIALIEDYAKEVTKDEFLDEDDNLQVKDAIIRRLEIIGEAVKNIPDNFKKKYPDIPQRQISPSLIWKKAPTNVGASVLITTEIEPPLALAKQKPIFGQLFYEILTGSVRVGIRWSENLNFVTYF